MKKVALVLCNDMHMDLANANILLNHIVQNVAYEVVCDYTVADIVIVNTCAFGPNKMYSMRVLADVRINSKPNAEVIATGCLLKLNSSELKVLPGIKVKTFDELLKYFSQMPCTNLKQIVPQNKVIISEGCLHKCSYCVYPMIVGKYRSKPMEAILEEIKNLYETESTIYITGAQETSDYGVDLYGKRSFAKLLEKIVSQFPNCNYIIGWFHPAGLTDEVISVISGHSNIVEIMLHIQHVNPTILKNMNRTTFEDTDCKIRRLKSVRPDLVISTEVIVGYPGETEKEFQKLVEYLREGYFDDIGVASYEAVLGTKAAMLPDQVDLETKQHRMNFIMNNFQATCYPADSNSCESVIEEYVRSYEILSHFPKNILKERQIYNEIAGVDTKEKMENFEIHLNRVFKCIVDSRSDFDFKKNRNYVVERYTPEARRLFYTIINNGEFKEAVKKRAKKLLLDNS